LVPPEWHSWLHYKTDLTPDEEKFPPIKYKLPHLPNDLSQFGVDGNYVPPGHLARVVGLKGEPTPSEAPSSGKSRVPAPWNRNPPTTATPPTEEDREVIRDPHTWSAKMEKEQLTSGAAGLGVGVGTTRGSRYKPWSGPGSTAPGDTPGQSSRS
jgi:hypothetical protein